MKNVLPLPPNSARAAPKVEQNLQKLEKCSTADSKFRACDLESRTKSPKIGKMFYSVTFAKSVWSQITGKSTAHQKSPFRSQHNSGAVIEQMMRSTAFGKITAVYGHIDENGRLSVKIKVFRTRFYGQNLQKAVFVRKMRFDYGQISKKWRFVRKI
ncbi:hypothetical protein [Ligilactobacillus ruminis]|uniref:hypothetical protein n=2 Tax=Ligilactobacillus ruminis TaxID=1623 RepID=UPI00265AE6DB|nr:hypothetical protein [Ligilactobacillus ruminis]WKB71802.1 hypothetical protein QYH55_10290 [Ligilactobacillus ruminis]